MAFAFPGGHFFLNRGHQPNVDRLRNLFRDLTLVNLHRFLARIEHHPAVGAFRHVAFQLFFRGGVGGVV